MRMASKNRRGFEALEGLEEEFEERREKCRILRDMIQALESGPVRAALAEWKTRLTKDKKRDNDDQRVSG